MTAPKRQIHLEGWALLLVWFGALAFSVGAWYLVVRVLAAVARGW